MEKRLCEIWENELGISDISVLSDFFEIGGHSLLAAKILAKVEVAFGVRIDLAKIYDKTSIAALAGEIDRKLSRPQHEDLYELHVLKETPSKKVMFYFLLLVAVHIVIIL